MSDSGLGNLETGVIYCGDNLERLRALPSETVDLIYLDPPFFSNRTYEVIWGDEAEVRSFRDRWEGGVNHYIGWMRERVTHMHRILKPTGTLYLHCDWHASHHLRVMLEDIFGANNFLNEIVWHYRKWSNKTSLFQRNHDTIFSYRRSPTVGRVFNRSYMERASSTMKRFGNAKIISGFNDEGRRVPSKVAPEDSEGVGLDDVWHISRVAPLKQLYPTEKPPALLERIIAASTDPGQIVLDPFCGCGTTIAAAHDLGRQWIGIDISPTAVNVIAKRLGKLGANIKAVGLPTTEDELRTLKPHEFQNWVISRVNGTNSRTKSGDMGIDGYSFLEQLPIQVKRSSRIGRNVVDNFETAIERYGADKGYIVAFSFGRGAREEVARVKAAKGLEVELVTVRQLLDGSSLLVAPLLNRQVYELPLPKAPPKAARPSADELIASDQNSDEVA